MTEQFFQKKKEPILGTYFLIINTLNKNNYFAHFNTQTLKIVVKLFNIQFFSLQFNTLTNYFTHFNTQTFKTVRILIPKLCLF